jgi:hypothetical protein
MPTTFLEACLRTATSKPTEALRPPSGTGTEALRLRSRGEPSEVLAAAREQGFGLVEPDPAVRQRLVHMAVGGVGDLLRAAPARLNDVPAISGRLGLVHDQRGGRALLGGFLIFVGPAAVIGHRAPAERAFEPLRLPIGIVDQDDDRLPLDVDARIIVPAALGRVDAVADEHDIAVLDVDARRHAIGADHHLRPVGEAQRLGAAGEGQRADVPGFQLDQRHVLEPAAIVAGLEARRLELLDQIGQRLGFARRARLAALELVGGETLRDRLQRLDRDVGRR